MASFEDEAIEVLKSIPLLKSIEQSRWNALAPLIEFSKLVPEETLFDRGRKSEKLHVILSGALNLYLPETKEHREILVGIRQTADTAGDFAVLNGGEHLVTARSATHTSLASLPRSGLEKLANLDPSILSYVYDTAAELSRKVLLIKSFLRIFGDISDQSLVSLLEDTKIRHLRSGEELFNQGDTADGLYIVMAGRLPITVTNLDNSQSTIAYAQPPQMVGEFSLITDSVRSATVYASRESMVAFLSKHQFHQHIMRKPKLLASVSRMIVERQRANVQNLIPDGRNHHIAILPLTDAIPIRRIVHLLKTEIRRSGGTLALDHKKFDTLYGKDGAAQTKFSDQFNPSITAWLDDRESRYNHVLYVADPSWNAWTHRCLNRADRVILIADTTTNPSPTEIENKLVAMFNPRKHKPRIEYVFLHPPDTKQPKHTKDWLLPRQMDCYHHIRMDDVSHFARLARRLTGRAIGLVLSGGGARGYVHLGVQKALQDSRVPIDYIGGSSMGALLGGTMSMGMSYQQVYELSKTFANPRALFDYTLPISALMKSYKLTTFCKKVFKDARIEDLWIPYFCISSNLSLGIENAHETGLLWRAIRSSIAIPGVFSPVPQANGELHVDGAVLNTFPVEKTGELLFGGKLIGVNVSQIQALEENYNYGPSLSGWRILRRKFNPFKESIKAPRILETLLRSNDIKSVESMNHSRRLLDILIEPNVHSYSLLDFGSYKDISEIGYDTAIDEFVKHGLIYRETNVEEYSYNNEYALRD